MATEAETKHTPGPWKACKDGDCSCGRVWSTPADHPVATVISGEWGDTWPALRIVGSSSADAKAEAYLERAAYGTVDVQTARANARLVAAAPAMHDYITSRADQGCIVARSILDLLKPPAIAKATAATRPAEQGA